MSYTDHIRANEQLIGNKNGRWTGINAESVARMQLQNRFRTGLDIAKLHRYDHARRHGRL